MAQAGLAFATPVPVGLCGTLGSFSQHTSLQADHSMRGVNSRNGISQMNMRLKVRSEGVGPKMTRSMFLTSIATLSLSLASIETAGRQFSDNASMPCRSDIAVKERLLTSFSDDQIFQIVRFEADDKRLIVRPTTLSTSCGLPGENPGLSKAAIDILGTRNKLVIWCDSPTATSDNGAFTWGREHPRASGSYEYTKLPHIERGGQTADRRVMKTWRARRFSS